MSPMFMGRLTVPKLWYKNRAGMAAMTKAQLVQALAEVWSDMKPAMDPPSTPPRSNNTDRLPAACKQKRKMKKRKQMGKRTLASIGQPKGTIICANHGNICTAYNVTFDCFHLFLGVHLQA